jgi:beta-galactosidase
VDRRPADELVRHEHTVDGAVHRHVVEVPPEMADLPRIGATFTVPARFDAMRWCGRGPHENYPDRMRSAIVGVWEGPVDALPYLVPQEHGLRMDCRWFELIDTTSGETVRIDALMPEALHISAVRHSPAQLFAAATATDLPASDHVIVCIDVAHRGLGTASCGPDVLTRYRIGAGRFEFAYSITRIGIPS